MNSENKEAFLNRAALVLIGIGVILLLVEIVFSAYTRLNSGGPSAASAHFSGTEGYRFIALVGFIFSSGLVYSLKKLGKVLGWAIAGIVLWQIGMWFSAYQTYNGIGISLGIFLEFATMTIVFLAAVWLFFYIPYSILYGRRQQGGNAYRTTG